MYTLKPKRAVDLQVAAVVGEQLLGPREVAAAVGVCARTLRNWVRDGRFPKPDLRPSATTPRWKASTVRAWIDAAGK